MIREIVLGTYTLLVSWGGIGLVSQHLANHYQLKSINYGLECMHHEFKNDLVSFSKCKDLEVIYCNKTEKWDNIARYANPIRYIKGELSRNRSHYDR